MGVKYSTGKVSRVKHSTGMEWKDLEKAKKKYTPIKHSTGENASIKHSSGAEFDYKCLGNFSENEEKKPIYSKARSKAETEGDDYLEGFHRSMRKERK
ncbi:hypothetical protein KAV79_02370 [Candidatus Aerophobetes bacterium]|nr:hypothetical protein [Candidatus Aerophobetes bacterium]